MMTSDEQFGQWIARGHEILGVEFKGPCPRTSTDSFARVVRAILGMANLRDGGKVIIGVDDLDTSLEPKGLTQQFLKTWRHDHIAQGVLEYADPYVDFETEIFRYKGDFFIVLHVKEFDEIPVLCKKDYPAPSKQIGGSKVDIILKKGACYVRRYGMPSTSEIPSHEEMRALIQLATDKGVAKRLRQAHQSGLYPCPALHLPPGTIGQIDGELFEQQIKDLR